MIKKLLYMLGFAKAPAPVKSYLAASSFVGTPLALAYVAWKNRDRIRAGYHRLAAGKARVATPVAAT